MAGSHTIHPALTDEFHVTLVGAGGSGSQMLTCLGRLHRAITALGHPGFTVTVYDPDTVSDANVGRQMFAPADVGLHKASVLVHRVDQFFGLAWSAYAYPFPHSGHGSTSDLVISCVDTTKARRQIDAHLRQRWGHSYLLDLGNRAADGQAILGEYQGRKEQTADFRPPAGSTALPSPYALLPELLATTTKDEAPSCSLAEALERQELFVNDDVVRAGCQILWNLLRHGQITWHGAFVNCKTGRRTPLPVDPETWQRMTATDSTNPTAKAPSKSRRKP